MADQHNESSQSFYSVYSHHSIFNNAKQREPLAHPSIDSPNSITKISTKAKIVKSNINLDGLLVDGSQIQQKSLGMAQMTKRNMPIENNMMAQTNKRKDFNNEKDREDKENGLGMEEVHNISEIEQRIEVVDQSMCLLKEIDCLSVEEVSPEELKEIKKKIDQLKKEQFNLQGSLTIAKEMLRNAQSRNTILQEELSYYKAKEQEKVHNQQMARSYPKVEQTRPAGISKEHRYFSQVCAQPTNSALSALKALYKQCSTNQTYCVYQNDGYKIEVAYLRNICVTDVSRVMVSVRLTPHHHIASRRQFRFGIEVEKPNKKQFRIDGMSYDGGAITQQFASWPSQRFQMNVVIHELDESKNQKHCHLILVPLPITHFLEPRLVGLSEQNSNKVKGKLSQYSLSLSGSISSNSVEKLKDMWWVGRFISCLGEDQIVYVEMKHAGEEEGSVGVEVFGKTNGKITTGVIEFLSFYLVN